MAVEGHSPWRRLPSFLTGNMKIEGSQPAAADIPAGSITHHSPQTRLLLLEPLVTCTMNSWQGAALHTNQRLSELKMYPGLNEANRIQKWQVWLYQTGTSMGSRGTAQGHMDEWECPLWDKQLARNRMRLASDNCRWWDVLRDTSVVLTYVIMQIQIDKAGCFSVGIRDWYLHFTAVHISWFCSYWFVVPGYSDCKNLLYCLSELLMTPGRTALTKGQGQMSFLLTPSWHLQPCSPE